jgi:hypothetical protein
MVPSKSVEVKAVLCCVVMVWYGSDALFFCEYRCHAHLIYYIFLTVEAIVLGRLIDQEANTNNGIHGQGSCWL